LTLFWQLVLQKRREPLRETSTKARSQAGAAQVPRRAACPLPSTAVTFTVQQSGLLAPLIELLTSALTRRYVDRELRGLKLRSENP